MLSILEIMPGIELLYYFIRFKYKGTAEVVAIRYDKNGLFLFTYTLL